MKRRISKTNSALAFAMALILVTQQGIAEAAPGDIFQMSAPVVGSDPPKAAEIHDGDASVASQTGALTFSYPISVPPGRQGMQPHLALSYSSQAPIYGGIAAGWSLSIPIITEDTAHGRLAAHAAGIKVYKSSMAGDRPLVPTSEGTGTYRAQNDSTFQRYQKVAAGIGYQWVVYTTDGQVHYFGDSSHTSTCTIVSDGYAPLTRSSDAFGNTVDYYYELGADGECRISSITWGENPNAALPHFATINFTYSIVTGCQPPVGVPGPPTATPPIGSQTSYRTGTKIVTGASKLDLITTVASDPISGGPVHTRQLTLAYDSNETSCTAAHSAFRALHSIQESAWGVDSPQVDLPAEVFTYGSSSLMTTYPAESSPGLPWSILGINEDAQLVNNLSWGYRPTDGRWPTVEATFVDLDGDGLLDRLVNYPVTVTDEHGTHVVSCRAEWQRNTGGMNFDTGDPRPIPLPTLQWMTTGQAGSGSGSADPRYTGGRWANDNPNTPVPETCSLNYQLTAYANGPGSTGSSNGSTVCADLNTDATCTNGVCSNGADCTNETASANFTTLAYRWFDIDGDGLTDLVVSPAQGGYGLYDLQWGRGFTLAGTVPQEPMIFGSAFANGMGRENGQDTGLPACPTPGFTANATAGRYTMCGGMYPWFIYHNHGNGVFSSIPDSVEYQPIPLEPDNGTSSIMSNVVTQLQGNLDIDGDGFPDAVSGGGSAWTVYRNDGTGQLRPMSGSTPFGWAAGPNDTLTTDTLTIAQCQAGPNGCDPLATAGLYDANGDGLIDQWDIIGNGSGAAANVEYNDGTSFRTPGGAGELILNGRPATDATSTVSDSFPYGHGIWVTLGNRGDTWRTMDLDLDGRVDIVRGAMSSSMLTTFNQGGQFAGVAASVGDTNALRHWIVASNAAQYTWEVRADMFDLDGDGIPEAFNMGTGAAAGSYTVSKISTNQPPRLLTRIDNGRGAHTDVTYSSMNSSAVSQDTIGGKVMPRTQWVVDTLATTETIPANTTTTTSFHYFSPRFLPDERGLYGFRGFDEVDTTLPTGAVKVDRYSYSPDWSGRLAQTLIKPIEAPTEVRSIDTTTWVAKNLFCDASNQNCVTTYHAQSVEHLTCMNGMFESSPGDLSHQCDSAHAPYTIATTTWSACDSTKLGGICDINSSQSPTSLLWLPTRTLLQSGTSATDGDRETYTTYAVWSDGQTYRVKPLTATKQIQTAGTFVVYAKTGNDWNQDPGLEYTLPLTDLVWFDNSNPTCTTSTDTCAVTRRDYDRTTGNVTARWKPMQNSAGGPSATYDYDSRKLFIATEHSEPGGSTNTSETRSYIYEYGTGTKLETIGPNVASCAGPPPYTSPNCPSGTTYQQDTRIRIDGLGRTLNRWSTFAKSQDVSYRVFERERNTYVDAPPRSVTTLSAIDFDAFSNVRFVQSKVDLDGHGRTIKKTVDPLGVDQETTYSYDNRGLLTSVSVPDPSVNTSTPVDYTYTFDSLGRATSVRRPDATMLADRSGVDINYDGLVTTTAEFVGAALGSGSTTVTTKDPFGRLVTVAEQTAPGTYAVTTYAYDGNDNVTTVIDPTAVTTTMAHDFASRRTSITRASRTWGFVYDKNGNQIDETFPGATQPDLAYTNSTVYDDLDYPTSTLIGQRGLSGPDAQSFGESARQYVWNDSGFQGADVGRLNEVLSFAPNGDMTNGSVYIFDLDGNTDSTIQVFPGLNPGGLRVYSTQYNLANSLTTTQYYDLSTLSPGTSSTINYDNRGLPLSVDLTTNQGSPTTIAVQTRNVAGLVTKRHTDVTGSPMTESNWTYDPLGRVASQVVQGGPGPTQVARQDLAYFGNDDLKSLDHWLGTTNHKHYDYAYDLRHQLTAVGETLLPNAFTASYAYNDAGRFISANESAAALPGSDVRLRNVNYQYAGADPEELTALTNVSGGATAWAYAYDDAGNQTMRCSGSIVSGSCTGTDETDYLYDGSDRLRRATRKLSGVIQGSEQYWYDGHGNRNVVSKRDATGSTIETLWFINDVEAHYDGAGTWVHSYAHVSMGTPVARVDTGTSQIGQIEFQFHGLANNTLAAVDQSTGTINASFDYAPFGEVIEATNDGGTTAGVDAHRRRMNDKFVDEVSELAYYGYRYFDRTSMNWTQSDPRYRFAPDTAWSRPRKALLYTADLNNPLRYIDPDGRDQQSVIDAANAAISSLEAEAAESATEGTPSGDVRATGLVIAAGAVATVAVVVLVVTYEGPGDEQGIDSPGFDGWPVPDFEVSAGPAAPRGTPPGGIPWTLPQQPGQKKPRVPRPDEMPDLPVKKLPELPKDPKINPQPTPKPPPDGGDDGANFKGETTDHNESDDLVEGMLQSAASAFQASHTPSFENPCLSCTILRNISRNQMDRIEQNANQ